MASRPSWLLVGLATALSGPGGSGPYKRSGRTQSALAAALDLVNEQVSASGVVARTSMLHGCRPMQDCMVKRSRMPRAAHVPALGPLATMAAWDLDCLLYTRASVRTPTLTNRHSINGTGQASLERRQTT